MLKEIIRPVMRLMPLSLLKALSRQEVGPVGQKLGRLGLAHRDVTLPVGVGKGLRFNTADANPASALGTYELPVQAAIAQHLRSGDTFFDIGANVGFFSILAARLVGTAGRVYAFEPDQANADAIRHNIALNGFSQVEVLQKAVSHTDGTGTLLLTSYAGGHTLSSVAEPPVACAEVSVNIVSIDSLIAQGSLPSPSLVKIDVEGVEMEVLKGMTQTLTRDRPTLIYETDDQQLAQLEAKQKALNAFVQQFSYTLTNLDDAYGDISWNVGHTVAIPSEKVQST